MKKRLILVAAVLLAALCLCAPGAWAETENGYTYVIYSTGAAISGYNGTDTELIVPDTLGGSPVTQISADAFSSLAVTSITLPDSVTTIGNRAFSSSTVRSVSLPAGLTQLGSSVFQNCKALEAIVIPDGITQLNTYTFDGCTALKDVALGSSLTAISSYAFKGCTSLESFVLPDSVTSIGTSVFSDCTALTDLTLSPNITSFGYDVFTNCPARLYASIGTSTAQALSTSNYSGYAFTDPQYPYFTFKYYSNTKWNITAFDGTVTDVVVPDGVAVISSSVFRGSAITSVSLPSSLLEIAAYTFKDCTSLSSVSFSDATKTIGSEAFRGCTSLSSISLPASLETIGSYAFYGCTALTGVAFPAGMQTIGNYAFYGCTNLPSVDIPASTKSIGENAFNDCLRLTSLTLREGLETIGYGAFYGCTNLPSVDIPASTKSIGNSAFYNCLSLASVTLREGLESIGYGAFYRCIALTDISLPSTLTAFSMDAFSGSGVTSIILPENITSPGGADENIRFYVSRSSVTAQAMAVKPNYRVMPFTDPEWPNLSLYYLIDEYTAEKTLQLHHYYGTDEPVVTIPDGIAGIYPNAFNQYNYQTAPDGNTVLEEIYVPDSVTSIGYNAFLYCSALKAVHLADNITSLGNYILSSGNSAAESPLLYCSKDSMTAKNITTDVYSYGFTDPASPDYSLAYDTAGRLVLSAYRGTEKEVIVPSGITAIGNQAFYENKTICDVILPEGLIEIRSAAFQFCSALNSVSFPSTLRSIGRAAFNACDSLDVLVLPDSLTTLESNSLVCSLEAIYLPDNITTVGTYPFYDSVMLYCKRGSVTAYNVSAENTGYRLCDPADPEWKYRYNDDGGLVFGGYLGSETELTIPDIYVGISSYAFSDSDHLKKIIIPESVTSLGYSALSCNAEEIYLPDNITEADDYALGWSRNCLLFVNTDSVTFATLSDLGSEFRYCDKKDGEWVYLRKEDGSLYAAGYRGRATELTFPDDVIGIAGHFDDYMPNRDLVTTIRIPENVRIIEYNVFIDCNYLTELYLPDNIEEIGGWPFDMHTEDGKGLIIYCTKDSQTGKLLGKENYAFCDLSEPDWLWQYDENETLMLGGYRGSATSITLPAGVTAIADNAFDYERDDHIVSITIPEGYESIGYRSLTADNLAHVSLPSTLRTIGDYAFSGCEFSMIQLPEGLETIGEYAFNSCDRMTSLTIPSTVTRIDDVIARYCDDLNTVVLPAEIEYIAPGAFGDSLSTVYCYRNTYAQEWAKDNAPLVRLIGEGTIEDLVKLTFDDRYGDEVEYTVFEVGMTTAFMRGVSVGTLPLGADYTFTCTSSDPSVARVDGEILSFLKPGKAEITIAIAERPDVAPLKRTLEVYNPVTSFTVPEAIFVHIDADDLTYLIPENIEPADKDTNPYFRRRDVGNGWWEWCNVKEKPAYGDKGVYFLPEGRLGAIKCEIESFSGVTQPILFVTYDKIGEVYANPPARPLVIGQIWEPDVTVMVDGAELEKLSYLYTLKTSNAKVAAITEDEMIRAVAPGTATITVTARNSGKTAKFTVTVTEAVTLHLPAALTAVPDEAFVGAAAGEVVIPEGCASIGARAFADCANLYAAVIPASVTEIAEDAFEGCSGVTITTPASSAAAQLFGGMEGFTVVTE